MTLKILDEGMNECWNYKVIQTNKICYGTALLFKEEHFEIIRYVFLKEDAPVFHHETFHEEKSAMQRWMRFFVAKNSSVMGVGRCVSFSLYFKFLCSLAVV